MTDFQKEVAVIGILLAFLFAYSCYAVIAHTGIGGIEMKKGNNFSFVKHE